jgi:predicted PurR-regulated permease PerM
MAPESTIIAMSLITDATPAADITPPRNTLAALNAGAIVVAALYLGRDLLVPMVLAVLLAFVLAPLVILLQRARIGRGPAVLVTVAAAFALMAGIGLVVADQATSIAQGLPAYQATIQEKLRALSAGGDLIDRLNHTLQSMIPGISGPAAPPGHPAAAHAPAPAAAPAAAAPGTIDASTALSIARTVLAPILSPIATAFVVAIFAIFVLLAREDLRDRLVRLLGRRDLHRTILAMNDAASRLSRYFLFQLLLNAGYGVFVGTGLWALGMPGPALWGILAACMRFVPFIGTVIAVVPPVLLAVVISPGWSLAVFVLGLFMVTDVLVSQVVEPLLYGHSTGLSPIAIIVSAAFWAFLWGPIGLLLATPLTVCLVVLGRHIEQLTFLEVMLGDKPPLEPAETFYQRALEGNGRELCDQARRAVAAGSLPEYYDHVAMQGLALAQADLARDALEFERLDAIHAQIETLLAALASERRPGTASPASAPASAPAPASDAPAAWKAPGAIAVIPGRGQLDGLAATMATQVLQDAGFGAVEMSNATLGNPGPDEDERQEAFGSATMCCLSVLDNGSTASGIRYLLRRIQRHMPGAAIVVCLWHADANSPLLHELRAEGEDETIIMSLGELVALTRALSARKLEAAAA